MVSTQDNVDFNALKFVALRYGENTYFKMKPYIFRVMSEPIDSLDSHKDLGAIMHVNGTLEDHVTEVIKKVKKRIGWVCRPVSFMRHMYISLIRPYFDYRSQLWGPPEGVVRDRLEKYKRNFLLLVPEIRDTLLRNEECGIDMFEKKLDKFIKLIPDSPRIDVGSRD